MYNSHSTCTKMQLSTTLCLLVGLQLAQSGHKTGPVGPITIHEFFECDDPVNTIDLNVNLNMEEDGSNSVSVSFETAQDYDNSVKLVINMDQWENNMWRNMQKSSMSLFDFINKYLPKPWEHVRDQIEPKIEPSDRIPAGAYKLNNFKEIYQNVDFPQMFYGRFKIKFLALLDEKEVFCRMAEVETFEPES